MPFFQMPGDGGGNDFNWVTVVIMLVLSAWGGFVNYLGNVKKGFTRLSDFLELFKQLSISCFAGLMVGLLATAADVNPLVVFALAGVAGHAGGITVYFMDRFYRKKLKSIDDDLSKD